MANRFARGVIIAVAMCGVGLSTAVQAAPTADDYRRSLQLRQDWQGLTRDVAWIVGWRDDGRLHYRKTVDGGFAFIVVDPQSGERQAAFDQAALAKALSEATGTTYAPLQLPFETFESANEGKAIRFRIGEIGWLCTLAPSRCTPAEPSRTRPRGFGVVRDLSVPGDTAPRRSPDGRHEALIQGDNVVVRALADGEVVLRSADGSPGEFYDPESLVWSPDSRRLIAYRVRPGHAREVLRVETSPRDQLQPRVQRQLYPKPGDAVDIEHPVLFDVAQRHQTLVDDTLFGNPYRLSAPRWRTDSASFTFEYTRRGHQQVRLIEVDADSARAQVLVDETMPTFVDTWRMFRHELGNAGQTVFWVSERDGWRHLYRHDRRGDRWQAKQLTRGDWIVREVLKVDEAAQRIWFTASGMDAGRDPYFRHLFQVGFDGRGLTRLTEVDADHQVAVSADGQWYVDLYSRVDLPPVLELRRADGSLAHTLERGNIDALLAAGWRAPQVFTAKGRDGVTDIWGLVVRPRDFDPAKKYPVVENIYAGPHDAFVPKTFWPFGYHSGGDKVIGMQALADLGFIVVQIDGMGTANRSKAFHNVAWKNLADSGFPDRIAWHRAMAAQDPSYDITRVGIYGASAGGQSAANALLFHPDFYDVAVAYNGCYDNRMDKISWNEQWLGWPVDASYEAASTAVHAHKLQGELLLIVGEQDSNVDPASTMQVVDALVRAGKDFDLLNLPGEGHAAGRSEGPIDYAHRRQFDFFVRHLQGADTPRWNSLNLRRDDGWIDE